MSELLGDLLITVLFGIQASFTHPGIILPAKETLGDLELKTIVRKSQRNKADREVLGYSPRVWRALAETIRNGNEQLVENKHHLLSKIADLTSLGRNLLVAKEKAQDLCAEHGFEAEIRKLIEICIEKASKPISPNLEKGHHEKEMKLKQAYKRVLITSLQFLNNLIASNETRKLHLWMHLFGSPTSNQDTHDSAFDDEPDELYELAVEDINPNSEPPPSNRKTSGKQPSKATEIPEPLTSLPGSVYSGFASLSNSFNSSYYKPGLLTDIPRILGPTEIEALPMIVQNGIASIDGTDKDMQGVRCNILLAQESGRALLRELLVFLGAWEVEERDFCYKMMQSITEAILLNGLAPFAYEAFKDDKDIITPAQCVLLKLLVSIYRSPLSAGDKADAEPPKPSKIIPSMTLIPLRLNNQLLISSKYMFPSSPTTTPATISSEKSKASSTNNTDTNTLTATQPHGMTTAPSLLDTSISAYFIHIFRTDVLPNMRSIILQQGAIKSGEMKRENFEWSLWDLDRVYEGLYQFMEMMVVFAEDEESKEIMLKGVKEAVENMKFKDDSTIAKASDSATAKSSLIESPEQEDQESSSLVGELVALLVEMDRIIPRYLQTKPNQAQTQAQTQVQTQTQAAVHCPHSPPSSSDATVSANKPTQPASTSTITTPQNLVERPYDQHPGNCPPPSSPTRSPSPSASSTSSLDPDSTLTDPEEFTWPHIKKFCVLLLTNLSWKNNDVKDLVRERGGLAAVLNQCMVDDDNPFIREYAILCVRNLLEGNARNQKVVSSLERTAKTKVGEAVVLGGEMK
ncbi:hypothetical protein L211DRAFT_835950 [Terfezia boudieri ATCC MYA-4762]|uniref:Ataxin-10 homolog n=1 Tax=Terfezia boudieri ATCC MYA-4762 TaxID=1051890 RepID=A0A3N4LWB3_9PEZI|nr:hypothetical protein L211DRAFT_835950 [Terfezia boudieri ATCC MYA-4762]